LQVGTSDLKAAFDEPFGLCSETADAAMPPGCRGKDSQKTAIFTLLKPV
jgi:hypothetical protein